MSVYYIASYDIIDPTGYAAFIPRDLPRFQQILGKHGGKVLAGGKDNTWHSDRRETVVLIQFPSASAVEAWLDDEEFAPLKAIRDACTDNVFETVAPAFASAQRTSTQDKAAGDIEMPLESPGSDKA